MSGRNLQRLCLLAAALSGALFLVYGFILFCYPAARQGPIPYVGVATAAVLALTTLISLRLRTALKEELRRAEYTDSLTGMGNARQLQSDFAAAPHLAGKVLLVMRLNGFNRFNTLFGLSRSAQMVTRLAQQVQDFATRQDGSAYRLMLDTFALLLPENSEVRLRAGLDALIERLELVRVQDDKVQYTYHYTFACVAYFLTAQDDLHQSAAALASTLRAALDTATGDETRCIFINAENAPDWGLRAQLAQRVHTAWQQREFKPFYQMVYDLRTQKPVGAELLVRWQLPDGQLVGPGDFLPVVEDAGMTLDLDLYMLEEACKKIKGWMDAELVTVPLSVNISKLNLHRRNFFEQVIDVVERYGVPPILLELELSEAVLLFEKNDMFLQLMQQLHDYGFTLTMDHFAESDLSSINLLRDLPVDVVKIDRHFFVSEHDPVRNEIFIGNVFEMLRQMQVKVVVLGVENEQESALFRTMGCTLGQGFFFSKPICNEEFEKQIF